MYHVLAAVSTLVVLAVPAGADVRLPAVLSDHAVLQRETEVPFWGWADPGERVRIEAGWGATAEATADVDGRWRAPLRTPAAGGPYSIRVEGENSLELEDVVIGEVWLCSGQSNMEWTVAPGVGNGVRDWQEEVTYAEHPGIRLFDVPNKTSTAPLEEGAGSWVVCAPDTAGAFSATAFFFGRALERELEVPVGLVVSCWGGTVSEAWTSEETLARRGDFDDALERIRAIRANPDGADVEQGWRAWWERLATVDPGTRAEWMSPNLDDSGWDVAEVPGMWRVVLPALAGFDGVAWARREVELPADWAGRPLVVELGAIDDCDTTFWNGERIGGLEQANSSNQERAHRVPPELVRAGRNVLAVRVLDTGGLGGFGGKPSALHVRPEGAPVNAALELAGPWRWKAGAPASELGNLPRRSWFHQNRPTALYNAMIVPLLPLRFRGAIWYQGESNRGRPEQYRTLFPDLIADWRARFDQGHFPFYYVQIAPFRYGGDTGEAALLREAQTMTLAVPDTGMAVTMDIGEPDDIHPGNKQDVGERLALWALARTYGHDVECSGPMYRSMEIEGEVDGGRIRLRFDHGAGLRSGDSPPGPFTVAGADRVFSPAQAELDGETVLVWSEEVPEPVAARFGWGAADETNLWNGAGLPSPSFRTDDWERAAAEDAE